MDETVQSEETAFEQSDVPNEAGPGEGAQEGGYQDAQGEAQAAPIAPEGQETFLTGGTLDPTKLPPELQPIFKKMQGAYTKKMQDAASLREKASVVDKFYQDRNYAFQTLAQWAAQNGYSVVPVGQQPPDAQRQQQFQGAGIDKVLAEHLPPELAWMAEPQAKAVQAAVQQMLAPVVQALQQNQQTQSRAYAEREWDKLASELSDTNPGWEEHEEAMSEVLDFLQGSALSHPRFGSKHKLLYDIVTNGAASQAAVTKRMNQAVKNRPASSVGGQRNAQPNLVDRIRGAKSGPDAFKLAVQAAEAATRAN